MSPTSTRAGSLQFRDDLELKPNILERLGIDVPFTLARGVLSAVYVNIPYGNIATRTSSVSIGGVSLLLRTTALDAEDHPALARAIDKGKEAAVAAVVERTRKALAQALTESIRRAAAGKDPVNPSLPGAGVLGWAGRLVAGVAGGTVPGPAAGTEAAPPAPADVAAAGPDCLPSGSAGSKPWHIVPDVGQSGVSAGGTAAAAAVAAPPGFIERLLTRFLDNLMVRTGLQGVGGSAVRAQRRDPLTV